MKITTAMQAARETLQLESEAILSLTEHIGEQFEGVLKLLQHMKGRLVVTGIGKSANIAQKMVATFNSTGQAAVFMHAADAVHGDLGNVQKHDVVLCLSKSGDSPEIKMLVPLLKSMKTTLIGMVANKKGFLARHCDFLLYTPVVREACPNNLAPTTSTAVQMAMGDALAVALMTIRGFTAADFAKYHPGGALGKKLFVKMSDLLNENSRPSVLPGASIKEVLVEISSKRLGATAVLDKKNLVGIITDGDLRRMLEKEINLSRVTAKQIMNVSPKTIDGDELAVTGFQVMETHNISQLAVTHKGKYMGIVHLHDILKEGIF